MKKNFLIYGSYGYTGSLIAQLSLQHGLSPVLAGRNETKLKIQATALNLDYRVVDVNDLAQTKEALKDMVAVIHCAGPFKYISKNMALACLAAKTHYLDITGEFKVIDQLMALNEQARRAGIMILPGCGFDVVPSDCLAAYLKRLLPDATQLILAIASFNKDADSSISHGTAKTMLEDIPEGTTIRNGGVLTKIPFCGKTRTFDFEISRRLCAAISWGDLSSAWWSTHIPNIETYMALPEQVIKYKRLINMFKGFLKWSLVKKYIIHKIELLPAGPDEEQRKNSIVKIYAEAINAKGIKIAALMTTPNGYTLTALSTLLIVKNVLSGNAPIGFQTPSSAFTEDLVMQIPEVSRVMLP
ncbi:saccharopine dehydrogenase NADP-binding domain-containing protein [Fluoribacter dumoffii]|uniref:saccharopine dehydrogenase family protein n=1 Tax=Fluoribacter dumoffii TaxID=463 RepID=UPI00224366B8|nr:saccharopine dehydrogenase NADP-binding domain-containing protein [Fluoribacter dumoffii]MCW8386449.1 saccharopine dehydrogenase NADP-binding domain-containing protein [Fluoribacter dumoffii]MCW8498277.1 saccharopine dehydrogenase NADP-binding domain-containing protein [Fluoribacter dumoffii]